MKNYRFIWFRQKKNRIQNRKYGKSDPDPLQSVQKSSTSFTVYLMWVNYSEGSDPPEDLEVDSVPPYEDRLGPDGAEGENPVLPPQVPLRYRHSILHSQIFVFKLGQFHFFI
jgi:hypothetical protein